MKKMNGHQKINATVESRIWMMTLSVMLFANTMAIADNRYPQNPCYLNQHLYIGNAGLKKFNPSTQTYDWSVLEQHSTFEPVCTEQYVFIGSRDGLYAIDSNKGKVLWSVGKGTTLYSPVVEGDFIYAAGLDGQIQKRHAKSGKLVWQRELKGWLYPPVVINDRVIVGGQGRELYAFNTENGQLIWQRHVEQELVYRPVAVKPNIIVISTYGPKVMAINVETNKILWSRKEGSAPYTVVADDETIFYGDQDGILHAVNLSDGKEIWHKQLRGIIRSIPTIDPVNRNAVWVGTERGQLVALNKNNGNIIWQKQLKQSIVHSPMPLTNKIYVKVDSRSLLFESFSLPKVATDNAQYLP